MYQIQNITDDAKQTLNLILPNNDRAQLSIEYKSNLQSWYMTLSYGSFSLSNRKIYTSSNMLRQWKSTLPFGMGCFAVDGQDPYFIDDFKTGRCGLLVLTATEVGNFESYLKAQKG